MDGSLISREGENYYENFQLPIHSQPQAQTPFCSSPQMDPSTESLLNKLMEEQTRQFQALTEWAHSAAQSSAKLEAQVSDMVNQLREEDEREAVVETTFEDPESYETLSPPYGSSLAVNEDEQDAQIVSQTLDSLEVQPSSLEASLDLESTPLVVSEDPFKACLEHFGFEDFDIDQSITEVNDLLDFTPPMNIHS